MFVASINNLFKKQYAMNIDTPTTPTLRFWQNVLKYGLIYALISIVITLVYYIFDVNIMSTSVSITTFVITFVILLAIFIISVKQYRNQGLDGKITFLRAFLHTLAIGVIGGVVIGLFNYIFYAYIAPEYLASQVEPFIEMMEKFNLPEEAMDEAISKFEESIQPLRMLRSQLTSSLILSAVIGLFIGVFIKKDITTPEIKNV